MNRESFGYVVVFTFIVAFLFVIIIALVDNATKNQVLQNQKLVTAQAFLNAINVAVDDEDETLAEFSRIFGSVEGLQIKRAQAGDEIVLVKMFSGQGLWGTVTGVIAVDETVSRIIGLDIISHAETPGLGGRIEEDWFKSQFRNERIGDGGIVVRKGEGGLDDNPENGIVDGITGASLTSAAMETIVINEINAFREELGE